ncbi:Probable type I restriction enzyme BthVORF4518P M protein [Chlamydia trachomatis]|nr:Probable type I restriction enzyme BthVORF4518P M protein [Chlamydia trachomatis]
MHILSYLSAQGRAAIVVFPGILYRGGAEQKIRQYLVDNNFVEAIIQLPNNLFFGTSIATCILVLAKNKTNTDTLFIDASAEFKKATNNNILTEENIDKILESIDKKENKDYFAQVVPYQTIVDSDYNLSVSTYLEKEDTREKIDIDVLNNEIKETVLKIDQLRLEIDKIVLDLSK